MLNVFLCAGRVAIFSCEIPLSLTDDETQEISSPLQKIKKLSAQRHLPIGPSVNKSSRGVQKGGQRGGTSACSSVKSSSSDESSDEDIVPTSKKKGQGNML